MVCRGCGWGEGEQTGTQQRCENVERVSYLGEGVQKVWMRDGLTDRHRTEMWEHWNPSLCGWGCAGGVDKKVPKWWRSGTGKGAGNWSLRVMMCSRSGWGCLSESTREVVEEWEWWGETKAERVDPAWDWLKMFYCLHQFISKIERNPSIPSDLTKCDVPLTSLQSGPLLLEIFLHFFGARFEASNGNSTFEKKSYSEIFHLHIIRSI